MKQKYLTLTLLLSFILAWPKLSFSVETRDAEICVYGGTASGVMAAVAASREGHKVILVENSRWLGGMTGGGISHVDWGRKEAFGGTTLDILNRGYNNAQYRSTFEKMVSEYEIQVIYEHRLSSVLRDNKRIKSIILDYAPPDELGCPIPNAKNPNAIQIDADVFIDCSYVGDLMAYSGVSYTYGRESINKYGESLAGARPNLWVYDIDPYKVPGNSSSDLIPFVQDMEIGPLGSADRLIMGYCFRYKLDWEGKGIPIEPTDNYNPDQFELYRRGFKNDQNLTLLKRLRTLGSFTTHEVGFRLSNLNRALLTTTVYGSNRNYPDSDWKTRSMVWKFHQDFFRNLLHFLRTDESVPEDIQMKAKSVTFSRGIFDDTQGWPNQFYIREARRMISSYILTQKDLEGNTEPEHSVGLASYGVDDWPFATIVHNGKVAIQGGGYSVLYLDSKYNGVYKIPYEAIVPKKIECENLLVPVCCSASHIAMTSIRMEPVWMVLGESAGVAAAIAVESGVAVQEVPYDNLKSMLLDLGQKLERPD